MTEKEIELFGELRRIANEKYHGQFTVIGSNVKYGKGFGCCFGISPSPMYEEECMARGETLEAAMRNCIERDFENYLFVSSAEVIRVGGRKNNG